ncbi:MAG: CDP-alcohol phosphatidyltransferase family protein, partial [Muribaculaceae bacterium]|nr:CDP-alcohol phosphatidyltransferase family protein [Muribaculaceae bacterium]
KLRKVLRQKYGDEIPAPLRERFRKQSKPLMKYTNMLSFNTRTIALFIAVLVFQMPWLYFAFELTVLNIMLIYMMWR